MGVSDVQSRRYPVGTTVSQVGFPSRVGMVGQFFHAFLTVDIVNTNDRRFAAHIDCGDDGVQFVRREIRCKLFARLPLFQQEESFAFIEVNVEMRIEASWRGSRRAEQRTKRAQQHGSHFIGRYDLHRKNDHRFDFCCLSSVEDRCLDKRSQEAGQLACVGSACKKPQQDQRDV